MSTRDVVRGYYRAWTSLDLTKARLLLADDLRFEGSIDQIQKGDDLARALGEFVQMLAEVRLLAEFYSTEDAMLLYDCVTPTGTIRTAEYFKVMDGKIQEIKLVVDVGELRKMTAPRAGDPVPAVDSARPDRFVRKQPRGTRIAALGGGRRADNRVPE